MRLITLPEKAIHYNKKMRFFNRIFYFLFLSCFCNGAYKSYNTLKIAGNDNLCSLTVGSLFSGALVIYGTSSALTSVYWLIGGVCLLFSLIMALFLPAKAAEKPVVNM